MKKIKLSFSLLLILSGVVFISSCNNDLDSESEELTEAQLQQIPKVIIEKAQKAGFNTDEGLFKFRNGYLVEYDTYLTESDLDRLGKEKVKKIDTTAHYVTNNLVTGTRTINVFMDPAFDSNIQDALDEALARYNFLKLRLTFNRVNNIDASDIAVFGEEEENLMIPGVMGVIQGFTSGAPEGGDPAEFIVLNIDVFNSSSTAQNLVSTIAHEIGHAIGFRHTDFFDRSFSCGGAFFDEGQGDNGANFVGGTPAGPVDGSWMLSCSNVMVDREFNLSDQIALYNVYGTTQGGGAFLRYIGTNGDHFYTQNYFELREGDSVYKPEGVQCRIFQFPNTGRIALYRYFNPSSEDHLYTSNFNELGNGGGGYIFEGKAGYIFGSAGNGRVKLLRYFNTTTGDHLYTTNPDELGDGRFGYIPEGFVGYVIPIKQQ